MAENTHFSYSDFCSAFPVAGALGRHFGERSVLGDLALFLERAERTLVLQRVRPEDMRLARAMVDHGSDTLELLLSGFSPPADLLWQEVRDRERRFGALCARGDGGELTVHHVELKPGRRLRTQQCFLVRKPESSGLEAGPRLRPLQDEEPARLTDAGFASLQRWMRRRVEFEPYQATAAAVCDGSRFGIEVKKCLAQLCLMGLVQAGYASVEVALQPRVR